MSNKLKDNLDAVIVGHLFLTVLFPAVPSQFAVLNNYTLWGHFRYLNGIV